MRLFLFISFLFITSSCTSFTKTGTYRAPAYAPETKKALNGIRLKLPLKKFRITRGFSPSRKNHYGVDFAAPLGTAVYSSHAGKVIYAGKSFRGYGNLVVVEHPDGYASFYAHLHYIQIRQGSLIDAGTKIGSVGESGNARGVHLHFEFRLGKNATDPSPYFTR